MRVLIATHRFGPHARGGVETWTEVLADALLAAGHEVAVLARDDRDPSRLSAADRAVQPPFSRREERRARPDGELAVHWIVHRHADARGHRSTWDDRRFDAPIGTLLDLVRPDVFHLAHPDGWGRRGLDVARSRGVPTVVTLHDYTWICGRGQMIRPPGAPCARVEESRCARCLSDQLTRGPLRAAALPLVDTLAPQLLERVRGRDLRDVDERRFPGPRAVRRWRDRQAGLLSALEGADAVTAPSRWVADAHRRAGLQRDVTVIRQGLPPSPPPPDRAPGPLRVGFFGTAVPTKGLSLLLSAAASIPAGSLEVHVHGPTEDETARAASRAGLTGTPPAVRCHGPYAPEDAVTRMGTVDVVALPSLWDENAPMVAIEARWARRPLLVSDRGGLPELVRPGVDGWVEPTEPARWGERLALLAARVKAASEAAGRAERPRSAAEMAAEYLAVYGSALAPTA